jgi:hypothetical protein
MLVNKKNTDGKTHQRQTNRLILRLKQRFSLALIQLLEKGLNLVEREERRERCSVVGGLKFVTIALIVVVVASLLKFSFSPFSFD